MTDWGLIAIPRTIPSAGDEMVSGERRCAEAQCITCRCGINPFVYLCFVLLPNVAILGRGSGCQRSIVSISNCMVPAGTTTLTCSPARLPKKAWAKGEVTEILPSFKLASLSGTMV